MANALTVTAPVGENFQITTNNGGVLQVGVTQVDATGSAAGPAPVAGVDDGAVAIAGSGGSAGLLTYVKGTILNQVLRWTGAVWAAAADVLSFNGRQGAVVPVANDYSTTLVNNLSNVLGATGTTTDALNALFAATPSSNVATVAAWFVDAAAGNDNNDGKTALTAFKTSEKLSAVLCPGGQLLTYQQNTTVTFAAGAYGVLDLNLAAPVASGFFFVINCAFSSTADMPLTAVVNTNAATLTRGQLTVSSGAFTAKSRIRSTSGAHIGAITYSTGQNASAQNHFVQEWFQYNGAFNTVTIANGTNVVVDTLLVSFAELDLDFLGNSNAGLPFGFIEIHDAQFLRGANFMGNAAAGAVNLVACDLRGDFYGLSIQWQCRFSAASSWAQGQPQYLGCSFQAVHTLWAGSSGLFTAGNCVDGGGFLCRRGGYAEFSSNVEFENGGAGNAMQTNAGCTMAFVGKMWGASSAFAVGWLLTSGSQMYTASVANLAIPATVVVQMTGHNLAAAAVPLCYPRAGCVFGFYPTDPAAVAVSI